MPPAISIIVRTIGSGHFSEALESLCAQTRGDFEVIVVDMSGGAHAETLARYAPKLALRVLERPRMTRPRALNAGIAAASAPVIGILDDDNLYDPRQIEIFMTGMASTNAAYVYTGVHHTTYSETGARLATREMSQPFAFDQLLAGNFIYATGSAFRKEVWERLGGYDERFDVLEDWEFLIRVAQSGTIAFLGVVAGESRKFTGIVGVSAFDLEAASVRRCRAGVYWKHRRSYLARRRGRASAPARTPQKTARNWRLQLPVDLVSWFLHNLLNATRSH